MPRPGRITPGNSCQESGDVNMETSQRFPQRQLTTEVLCYPPQGQDLCRRPGEEHHCGGAVRLAIAKFLCSTKRELRSWEEKKKWLNTCFRFLKRSHFLHILWIAISWMNSHYINSYELMWWTPTGCGDRNIQAASELQDNVPKAVYCAVQSSLSYLF